MEHINMASIYHLPKDDVNGVEPAPVSGNYLSYNRYDPIGKAFMAADLHRGLRVLRNPTLVQSAWLSRVNRTYAFWADRRYAQRAEIEAGLLPLVPPTATPKLSLIVPRCDFRRRTGRHHPQAGIARTLDIAAMVEAAE
jgi:hypothetical protein